MWGLNGLLVRNDEIFSQDGHGSSDAAYSSETVVREYDHFYDAFGNEVTENAADTDPFRYYGEYFDPETGQTTATMYGPDESTKNYQFFVKVISWYGIPSLPEYD